MRSLKFVLLLCVSGIKSVGVTFLGLCNLEYSII